MNHGGRRPNAGRKRGSGKWGEATKAIRVPISRLEEIYNLLQSPSSAGKSSMPSELLISAISDIYNRPLYRGTTLSNPLPHPEPTETFTLNAYLLPHPERMIFVRAPDKAMRGAGIDEGDILIVDTHRPVIQGCLIAAIVNDELLIRQLLRDNDVQFLAAANPLYPPVPLSGDISFALLGVITAAIHDFIADCF